MSLPLPGTSVADFVFASLGVVTRIYIGRFTMNFMNEKTSTPSLLRLAAAVFLGLIVGSILFFIAAMVIGSINQLMGMNIPVEDGYCREYPQRGPAGDLYRGQHCRVLLEGLGYSSNRRA